MKKITLTIILFITLIFNSNLSSAQNTLQSNEYGALISNYLEDNKISLGILDADMESILVTDSYKSQASEINHVYIQQAYEGIKIYNAISSVAIKDNVVFYFSNRMLSNIDSKINTVTPSVAPSSSVATVVNEFQLGQLQNLEEIDHQNHKYIFSNGSISNRNITAELVFFNTGENLRLAWDVMIYAKDDSHWHSVRMDALTNEVLDTNDLILNCSFGEHNHKESNKDASFDLFKSENATVAALVDGASYNVFALPIESPNHGPRQLVTNPASPVASPFGWHDTDGVAGPEFTITRGNNVYAREDRDGSIFTIGFAPDGGAALNFDFPLDIDQPPSGYQDVAITNLFYANNMMHDIWYLHGFDEASGNFQLNNYGNPGLGNDYVNADAQDGSGLNNATFGTPPDGSNPVMTMFLWSPAGGLDEPLTIDNGTVAGSYDGSPAGFGAELTPTPIAGNLALAEDNTPDIYDACDAFVNAADLNGNIAVLRRGSCEFGFKVLAAENAGAIAVIVVNNQPGATITMGAGAVGGLVTIPSIMVNQADGEAIIAALLNGEDLSATLVNNGPFLVDGDFDNGIIAHEFGHGISNRLNSGPSNVGCLFNDEQMGEGWSDWFGLMVTMEPGDQPEDIRGIGTFAVSQPTDGGGIRPAPYSTDFSINPFTYGATNNTGLSQPHGIGFVWSTMLWDLTWAYIEKYGFDPDLYNGNGGNNKVMRLVLDGLKLQPCQPGFIDGRDALLAADQATTGGVDQCLIWEVFAKRGLGFNASQGLSTSRTDQIEDFSTPPIGSPSLANCTTLSTDEFSIEDVLTVYPNPVQDQLFIDSRNNFDNVTVSLVDINGRVVLNTKLDIRGKVALDMGPLETGIYILNLKGDNVNYNTRIIKN
ncbi:T9SS-dependent M36 family metallopeptidase [Winogradskyella tangerina]|uniref:T9SS-dependent M36 family metallopeptidase n=1 Tax=Winogradskyella tangerina TaxID=2023240 RepID=UPI000DBE3728|nr:T9SS-dependent M36 family metallopeptidase [Winogradskyella tangerina]